MPIIPRRFLILFSGLLVAFSTAACNHASQQSASPSPAAKRYHLKGKVVAIDKQAKMANIDAEAIPDFMGAMTMPYQIKPEDELNKLSPGDAITADVVDSDDSYWLENVVVTGHSPLPAAK
jgi:protein SCO1/2